MSVRQTQTPSQSLFLCVDGGGTRSRGRLLNRDGGRLAQSASGPCNPSTDRHRALASLAELWGTCAAAAHRPADDLRCVTLAIGAAGLYVPSTREAFLAAAPRFGRVVALTDGYAALVGAGGGAPSALIVAGTGVAGHRLFADGHSIQRDAWGWVAGDRGSGAWIGRKALRHFFAAIDGLVPADDLSLAIGEAIGGTRGIEAGYLRDMTPDRLGALAPPVLDLAARGQATALALRTRAVAHLEALAGLLAADKVPLYAAGGVADVLRPLLAARLSLPVLVPEEDALHGCWLVASGQAPPERADFFRMGETTP